MLNELPAGAWTLLAIDMHDKPWTQFFQDRLSSFSMLRGLNLKGSTITDDGLKVLAVIKSLKEVDLTDTDVTPEGVAELRKALPNCKIVARRPSRDRRNEPEASATDKSSVADASGS